DGSVVYVVEAELESKTGRITIRDGKSFSLLGELPTYGRSPHDCTFANDGGTLVVTNGGGPLGATEGPCVTFGELGTGKLVERIVLGNTRINAGHIGLGSNGDLVVVSAPRDGLPQETTPGGVSIRPAGQRLATQRSPAKVTQRMLGESLSVCLHEPSGTA